MRFAHVDGQRQEAQPGLAGECPSCGQALVAKCGQVKVWHWAHSGRRTCDPWWENETEWHRAWKGQFPVDWQERIHRAEDGEKHIADVKTDRGWVLEFQHSHLNPQERHSRIEFYKQLAWVVDGTRLKRGLSQFSRALDHGIQIFAPPTIRSAYLGESALLREWATANSPVFLDFGGESPLWYLMPRPCDTWLYVSEFPRAAFIELHRDCSNHATDLFADHLKRLWKLVAEYEHRRKLMHNQQLMLNQPRRYLDPLQVIDRRRARIRRWF